MKTFITNTTFTIAPAATATTTTTTTTTSLLSFQYCTVNLSASHNNFANGSSYDQKSSFSFNSKLNIKLELKSKYYEHELEKYS
jgi:hypothetical protein